MDIDVREILGIAVSLIGALLVTAKADKQLRQMLEGKAHRIGKEQRLAVMLFAQKKRIADTVAFSAGVGVVTGALVLIEPASFLQWFVIACGGAIMIAAIAGRMKSFRSADEALSRSEFDSTP